MGPRLVLEPMDAEGPPFVCDDPELRVGRGIREVRNGAPGEALLDIDAGFPTVSREHALIRRDKGAYVVENSGKHGTFVNGAALQGPRPLADGDVIQFGRDGPRYVLRVRAGPGEAGVRRCPGCREIVPMEEVERHDRECEVLHPPGRRPGRTEPPAFSFGPLRTAKRNLLIVVDVSGGPDGNGSELSLVGPGLIDALQPPALRFNVLAYGGSALDLWRGPDGRLRDVTDEARADAREWIRARARPGRGGKPPLAEALRRAFGFRDVEAIVLLAAGEPEEVDTKPARGVEIHAVGLGPLYDADSRARTALRSLSARHAGGFFSVAARA